VIGEGGELTTIVTNGRRCRRNFRQKRFRERHRVTTHYHAQSGKGDDQTADVIKLYQFDPDRLSTSTAIVQ
jgi:hypothetical protein